MNRLTTSHIDIPPDPTSTLVQDGPIRIDTQPATKFRNIRIQENKSSYAVTAIDHGAEICSLVGYSVRLLKYLKEGLYKSYQSEEQFNIRVTIDKRIDKEEWRDEKPEDVQRDTEHYMEQIVQRLNHKQDKINSMKTLSANKLAGVTGATLMFTGKEAIRVAAMTEATKVARKSAAAKGVTEVITKKAAKVVIKETAKFAVKEGAEVVGKQAAKSVTKQTTKIAGKQVAKTTVKVLPGVSVLVGTGFGIWRALNGDFIGATAEVAAGFCATVPGVGMSCNNCIVIVT